MSDSATQPKYRTPDGTRRTYAYALGLPVAWTDALTGAGPGPTGTSSSRRPPPAWPGPLHHLAAIVSSGGRCGWNAACLSRAGSGPRRGREGVRAGPSRCDRFAEQLDVDASYQQDRWRHADVLPTGWGEPIPTRPVDAAARLGHHFLGRALGIRPDGCGSDRRRCPRGTGVDCPHAPGELQPPRRLPEKAEAAGFCGFCGFCGPRALSRSASAALRGAHRLGPRRRLPGRRFAGRKCR